MSGENLDAVHPPELRCQSQEAMLKAEFEEATRITPPPTEAPEKKVKCPANCVCEVSGGHEVRFQGRCTFVGLLTLICCVLHDTKKIVGHFVK